MTAERSLLSLPRRRFLPPGYRLPDRGAIFAHHFAVVRQIERFLEFRHVRERSVAAKFPGRMRVGIDPQLEIFVTLVGPPDLRPGEEEMPLFSLKRASVGS